MKKIGLTGIIGSGKTTAALYFKGLGVPVFIADDCAKELMENDDNLKKDKRNTVNSPMVGTFYASASPESKPFVTIGQSVKKGDTLCILEAMKMMNQVQAESDGKIVEILVDNAEPVEFDQPLFVLE